MKNVVGIIYSVKNKITGEYYVSATTSTMEKRKKDHEEKADNGFGGYFQSIIAGYGKEAFDWVQEDSASSLNELAKKEKNYIIKYDSKENGYNRDSGGGFKKNVYMYNIYGSYAYTFDSLQAAADWAGISKKQLSRTCLGKCKTISAFMWSYERVDRLYSEKDARMKKVDQIDLNGNIVNSYSSISNANKFTGINKSSIAKTCRGEHKTAGGYVWKFNYDDSIILMYT